MIAAQSTADGLLASFYWGDIVMIGIVCLAWPIIGRMLEMIHVRRIRAGVPGARRFAYLLGFFDLVLIAGLCLIVWSAAGREIGALGFHAPDFRLWDGWADIAVFVLGAIALAYYAFQVFGMLTSESIRGMWTRALGETGQRVPLLPANPGDAALFGGLGVTAGITEEIIFRGYLINALAQAMPLWAGGAVSLVIFVLLHAYQGKQGMAQVAVVGTIITGLYLAGASLWSLIALHILLDVLAALAMGVAYACPARPHTAVEE